MLVGSPPSRCIALVSASRAQAVSGTCCSSARSRPLESAGPVPGSTLPTPEPQLHQHPTGGGPSARQARGLPPKKLPPLPADVLSLTLATTCGPGPSPRYSTAPTRAGARAVLPSPTAAATHLPRRRGLDCWTLGRVTWSCDGCGRHGGAARRSSAGPLRGILNRGPGRSGRLRRSGSAPQGRAVAGTGGTTLPRRWRAR